MSNQKKYKCIFEIKTIGVIEEKRKILFEKGKVYEDVSDRPIEGGLLHKDAHGNGLGAVLIAESGRPIPITPEAGMEFFEEVKQ